MISPDSAGEWFDGERDFSEFAGQLMGNAADAGMTFQNLKVALDLKRVRSELEQKGHYVVFGGDITGCKTMTFVRSDSRYAMLYVTDLNSIAEYYKSLIDRLEKEQYQDTITGALNRNYYELKLRERHFSGGVAIIDIDDFKLCNDTYGHEVGILLFLKWLGSFCGTQMKRTRWYVLAEMNCCCLCRTAQQSE